MRTRSCCCRASPVSCASIALQLHRIASFSHRLLILAAQISRDMPHYIGRQWSQQDLEVLQGLSKQLRMYCAKIRTALAPIREAVSLQ